MLFLLYHTIIIYYIFTSRIFFHKTTMYSTNFIFYLLWEYCVSTPLQISIKMEQAFLSSLNFWIPCATVYIIKKKPYIQLLPNILNIIFCIVHVQCSDCCIHTSRTQLVKEREREHFKKKNLLARGKIKWASNCGGFFYLFIFFVNCRYFYWTNSFLLTGTSSWFEVKIYFLCNFCAFPIIFFHVPPAIQKNM